MIKILEVTNQGGPTSFRWATKVKISGYARYDMRRGMYFEASEIDSQKPLAPTFDLCEYLDKRGVDCAFKKGFFEFEIVFKAFYPPGKRRWVRLEVYYPGSYEIACAEAILH